MAEQVIIHQMLRGLLIGGVSFKNAIFLRFEPIILTKLTLFQRFTISGKHPHFN